MNNKKQVYLDFLSPLNQIYGLGSARIKALNESGIYTIGDLLYHIPKRYIDRSKIIPICECYNFVGKNINIIGSIIAAKIERGRKPRLIVKLSDETGDLELLWFERVNIFRRIFSIGTKLLCTGTIQFSPFKTKTLQIIHPQCEKINTNNNIPPIIYMPVYPITLAMENAHISQKILFKSIVWALNNISHYPKVLPHSIEKKYNFMPLEKCLKEIHIPSDINKINEYKKRLKYEELYKAALYLRWSKRKFYLPGRSMNAGELLQKATSLLPFALSEEQKHVINLLHKDSASPQRMHRLLMGDVGSGKTIVAFFACLPALNEGFQVAWMSPTEILAQQTYKNLSGYLDSLNIPCKLLIGKTDKKEKKQICSDLTNNKIKFLFGTHALLEPWVKFKQLGMIVIDEQHKFGAHQRLKLSEKDPSADMLVISATPIPQTLAKTFYGDLDVVVLNSLPFKKSQVSTHIVPESKRKNMEEFIYNEIIKNNAQVFYVVPRIEPTQENPDNLKDAETVFLQLKKGIFSDLQIGLIHGRTQLEERLNTINKFKEGIIKILVATTIIEVGIDIPSANILVIENAERFGLSQLHQIRGRIGRKESNNKPYCFLFTSSHPDTLSFKRLEYLCNHNNGFEIAEMDLKLRGPGEISGFRQTGWEDFIFANILDDADLFCQIQKDIEELFKKEN
jgi:ATP-dependent DNA helicase RecG